MSWTPVFAIAPPVPTSSEATAQTLITAMLNAQRTSDIDLLTKNTTVTQTQFLNEVNNNITNFANAPANILINMHYIKSPAFLKNNYALNSSTLAANDDKVNIATAAIPTSVPKPKLLTQMNLINKNLFTKTGFAALPTNMKIILILSIIVLLGGISAGIFFLLKKKV